MILVDLIASHLPECRGQPQETWWQHGRRLWADERGWMTALWDRMKREDDWLYGPVILDDGFVQDGHHRIVIALGLCWHGRFIPVEGEQ